MKSEDWIYEEPVGLDLQEWIDFKNAMKKEVKNHPERNNALSALENAMAVIKIIEERQ